MQDEQILEQYKTIPLKFSSYYKYVFTFVGETADGKRIVVSYGGSSDDIYRWDLSADEIKYIGDNYKEVWRSITIYDGDEEIFDWNDW